MKEQGQKQKDLLEMMESKENALNFLKLKESGETTKVLL